MLESRAAMEKAFRGTGFSWHPAMDKLLGKTVTVTAKYGSNMFGLPKSDPNHSQPTWYYPFSVIACVSPPEPTTSTTTTPCPGGGERPNGSNVQVGSKIKMLDSRAAFEASFQGKGYVWHPAMEKLLGKTVTVTGKYGAGTFGLPKSDPYHSQATWYYPIEAIACVMPPDRQPRPPRVLVAHPQPAATFKS